ncbi:MAG TPA: hypothetical protein VHO84_03855, partial [Syntrophorhabdaceae bacterium]|nr:hypothetical protein [Syntrophorhabdaceae bacterium]
MFCYQCEQTARGQGCMTIGVCGKQPDVSDLQDLLIRAVEELAFCATEARNSGMSIERSVNLLPHLFYFHFYQYDP